MKSIVMTGCMVFFLVSMAMPAGAVPLSINYQGLVEVGDEAFSGTGLFRFAIVDATGSVTYWSNDGNTIPGTDVPITVNNGVYQVILGDTGMMDEIPASVFDNDELYLRVWFNDGVTGLQQLSPDQPITSVGFALKAERAADAETLNGKPDSFFQDATNINAGTLGNPYFSAYSDLGTEGYLDNSAGIDLLTRTQSDARYVNEAQTDSVNSAMIVNETITSADLQDGTVLAEILDDDGAGSTLDADTIDGLNSVQFLRSDENDTMNGTLTVTGNLGIGTLTPETDLHVNSDSGNTLVLVESGTDNQAAVRYGTASYDWIAGLHGGNLGTFKISNAASFGTNDYVTITTDGNVGIGTVSPDGILEVSHNGSHSDLLVDGTSGNVGIGTASPTGTLLVSHNGSSADLFVDGTSGNVGIGNSSPIGVLSVGDKVYSLDQINYESYISGLYPQNGQWQSFIAGRSGNLTRISLEMNVSPSTTNVRIHEGQGLSGTQLYSSTILKAYGERTHTLSSPVPLTAGSTYTIFLQDAVGWLIGNDTYSNGISSYSSNYDFLFKTFMDGGSDVMVTQVGNLGVGTDAPQETIHARTSTGDCRILIESGTDSDAGTIYRPAFASSDWIVGVDGWNDFKFKIAASSDFGTNDFLTITRSGNVGINNSAPGSTLSVTGDADVTGDIAANTLSISSDAAIGGDISGDSLSIDSDAVIGGDIVGTGALYVTNVPFADVGNAQWDTTTHQFCYDTSSRRFKENITLLEDNFENLLDAQPMTYTRPGDPDRWEIGFIAEDFRELGLDRLLYFDENGDPFSINYSKISLYLLQIIKKQEQKIHAQEEQLRELTLRLERIEAVLAGDL